MDHAATPHDGNYSFGDKHDDGNREKKKRKIEGLEGAGQVVKEHRQQPLRCHGVMGEGPPPPHPRRHQSAHEAAKSRNSLARRKLRTEIGGGCKLRSV